MRETRASVVESQKKYNSQLFFGRVPAIFEEAAAPGVVHTANGLTWITKRGRSAVACTRR